MTDSARNTILIGLGPGLQPLTEAFQNLGFLVEENITHPTDKQLAHARFCLVGIYPAARAPLAAWKLKRRLAKADIPLVGLDRDAPWHMGFRRRRIGFFRLLNLIDIYATHTLQPTWKFAPIKHYHANAVWARNFNLHGASLQEMRDPNYYKWDVSFVGNMHGARYKEHAERERFFKELVPKLDALGLRVLFCNSGGMSEEEQIEVIQRSRINLNYRSSCDHGGTLSWGLPERCYGVPARGGFMLSDERKHAADDFDISREWASYSDMDDCITKIRYYLDHLNEARDIAEAAHQHVMRDHTYECRAAKLIECVDAWRSNH